MIDPSMRLCGGAVAARGVSRGINLLNGGLATARAGLIGSTAAEALLHASQETRTYGESAANISMTTFLGGLVGAGAGALANPLRSEEHTSELQSTMRHSYAVFCLKKKKQTIHISTQ